MHSLDTFESCLTERGVKVFCLIRGVDNDFAVLCACQLTMVNHSQALHNLDNVVETPNLGLTERLLK